MALPRSRPTHCHRMTRYDLASVLREVDRKMAYLRKTLGDDIDIALDPHAKILEPSKAIEMCKALEPYRPCSWRSRCGLRTWMLWLRYGAIAGSIATGRCCIPSGSSATC